MAEPLSPLTLALRGARLIEASAGTGKTWTLAALYLRLVLGHGCPARAPAQILVMTFTRAATRELCERIRRRLVEAAACFRGEPVAKGDDFLAGLLQDYPPGPAREEAAWRLGVAAEAMDEAAVHTIDAWCQRMLREHAFDSGCLFDEELQAHEEAMRAQAVRDYWRQHLYPLDDGALPEVLALWPDVRALAHSLDKLLDKPVPEEAGAGTLQEALARALRHRADRVAALKAGWVARAQEMLDWLVAQWRRKDSPLRKRILGESHATRWLQALQAWAQDPTAERPELGKGAERLTRSGLLEALEPGAGIEVPAAFDAFSELMTALNALPEVRDTLRLHAAACVRHRLQQLKAQSGTYGFADMLDRLDGALDEARHGERAQRLRQRILEQHPVALIDEFQDTSPVQLRIFDRLYRIADDDPSRALLLIGDPKQAIYGFRGADIYSYLRARQATAGRHHVLGTNFRSTQPLVDAVNALFEAAEARPGEGAFLFRSPGVPSPLPFSRVEPRGRPERLVHSGGEVAALTLVCDETLRNKDDGRTLFAALCAQRIVTLLNDPQCGFEEPDRPWRRLRPADIAVLVRTGKEAELVRRELRRRGLASVYLSDRDPVWRTPEAEDLLRLLRAVAEPRDARLARAALATRLLGLPLAELVELASDDARFDQACERLQQLHQAWRAQGVLAMVRQALHAFDLPARWLASEDASQPGERRLTNVLQLAELLQAACVRHEGEQALVRWLARQVRESRAGLNESDDSVLRLESDADLVKVVTLHKSKGLEYPLVFLPFAAHFREADGAGERDTEIARLRPATPDAHAAGQGGAAAERERLREDLRLLYVALTRAQHALWVGLSGLQVGKGRHYVWHASAIGCLLSGPQEQAPPQRILDLRAFAQARPGVRLELVAPSGEGLPLPPVTRLERPEARPPLAPAAAYAARFERHWTVSSYSALVRDAAWLPAAAGTVPARVVRDDEPGEAGAPVTPGRPSAQAWHRFPRGARAGNFLHEQLEWLAAERFALDDSPALRLALARRCERQGWGHLAEDVVAWLRQVCTRVLPPVGVPLAALHTLAPEMEFWFPSDGLRTGRVDELCRQHLLPGRTRPVLPERTLQGMLMGFADLVFEHGGRYWVLDYKSNALGSADADYTQEAMAAAMLEHRYDVQAALYLLALHRLLRARLGAAYAPERHLGGAIYLFLRGVHGAHAGCCEVAAPQALIRALDAQFGSRARPAGEEPA